MIGSLSWIRTTIHGSKAAVLCEIRYCRLSRHNPLILVDDDSLVRGHASEVLSRTAGPLHIYGRDRRIAAQAERQRQFALRAVTRSAADHVPLLAGRALDAHHGTYAVAVRPDPAQPHAQPVVAIAAVVAEKIGGAVVGGDQNVQVAVLVEIRVGGAARDQRPDEIGAHLGAHVVELVIAQIAKQQRRLAVTYARLHAPDLVFDVAVGGEDIRMAVQVVIEEEDPETQGKQAGAADGGERRLIHKKTGALVVIEPQHLVRKIALQQVRSAA